MAKCYSYFNFKRFNKDTGTDEIISFKIGLTSDLDSNQQQLSELAQSTEEILSLLDLNDVQIKEGENYINSNVEQFKQELENLMLSRKSFKEITIDDIETKGVIPNCNLAYIKENTSSVIFPDDMDAKILLVNDLNVYTNNMSFGRMINTNGEEVFILKEGQFNNFAKYLQAKKQLQKQNYIATEEQEKIIEQLSNTEKNKKRFQHIKSFNQLLLDFLDNKSDYIDIKVKYENRIISLHDYLNKIAKELSLTETIEYKSDLLTTIFNSKKKYGDEKFKWKISINMLLSKLHLSNDGKEIVKDLKSGKKFKEQFSKKIKDGKETFKQLLGEDVINTVNDDDIGFKALFKYLRTLDKTFPLEFISIDKDSIVMKYNKQKAIDTIEEIGYDTLNESKRVQIYGGYNIFETQAEGVKKYFYSYTLLEDNRVSSEFNSIDECINDINEKLKYKNLRAKNKIEFHLSKESGKTIDLDLIYAKDSIVEILDIPDIIFDNNTKIPDSVQTYFLRNDSFYYTIDKFFNNIVKNWNGMTDELFSNLKEELNSPELITAFTYYLYSDIDFDGKTQKSSDVNTENIEKCFEDFKTNLKKDNGNYKTKKYYIRETSQRDINKSEQYQFKGDKKLYKIQFYPANEEFINNYKKNQLYPKSVFFTTLADTIYKKLSVPVNVMTEDELVEQFGEIGSEKAFIKEGQIYINLNKANVYDLFHEYTHILLGIMKYNNYSAYQNLLKSYVNSKQGKERYNQLKEGDEYKGLSDQDLIEEAFAIDYGYYINNRLGSFSNDIEFNDIFKEATHVVVKQMNDNLFDSKISEFKLTSNLQMNDTFEKLSSDIREKLNKGVKVEEIPLDKYRRITNFIKQEMNNRIKEDCV